MTTDITKTEEPAGASQTGAVQPVAVHEIDWTALEVKWQKEREAVAAERKLERVALLEVLRDKEVTNVEAGYDGYGDSGNVGEIDFSAKEANMDDLQERLSDFIWGMAYGLHPGFENNDGGEGTFLWDVKTDRIDIEHANFYTERDEYCHEDV